MHVICVFTMQQRQQQCSYSQASRNAVQVIPKHVWQSPSKEEDHYTFRTIPREQ